MSGPGMLQWVVPATAVVLALLALALMVSLRRTRARTERELGAARAEAAALQARLAELERRFTGPAAPVPGPAVAEYLITHLGEDDAAGEPAQIDRALFADLVLRETVVRAAALGHGLRRALAPETRNRIRFEMKREVKRARKQRRAEVREARRDLATRQRAATDAA